MSKHTPGPWALEPATAHHGYYVVDAIDNTVCDLYFLRTVGAGVKKNVESHVNADANARLIAAAPELLAALKWFINDIDGTHTVMLDVGANVKRSRAAIAKAEGA